MANTIGILNPGAMGSAVAATMVNSGKRVLWASSGRSAESRARAESDGLIEVESLKELCAQSDAIVCVCPPDAAVIVAEVVIDCGFQGMYLDANAIAPTTSEEIGRKLQSANITYIDGGIIGGPPRKPGTTWLGLSGPHAATAAEWFAAGPLEVDILEAPIGAASGLKMCFAANTKITNALQSTILASAESLGVRDALERQWTRYDNPNVENLHKRVISVAHNKAWRFAGEMDEIAATFDAANVPAGFALAAAELYRRLAHFKGAPQPPDIDQMLTDIIENSGSH